MKRFTLVLYCLLAAVTLWGQSSQSTVSVLLPAGWSKVEGSVLEHQYLKNGASFMIKEEAELSGKTLNEAVNTAKQKIDAYFDDYELLNEEPVTVDNKAGKSITYRYSVHAGGMVLNMKMRTVYVLVNNKCQTLSFGAVSDQFDSLATDIEKILKGIRFK